jgi:predicted lipoprotein with Yx(FWY)xxD motif
VTSTFEEKTMPRFRRPMTVAASAFGLAVVLAACGSSASKTSTAASSPTTSPATSAATSSTTAPSSSGSPFSTANSAKGVILVDAHGKTLYVFDLDTTGKIACGTGCTALWPPLVVPSGSSAPTGVSGVTATLGTVMRPDGTTQLTSDGRPLYTFARDTAAGQTNGDGFGGIWHVAKVTGNGPPPGGGAASTSSSSSAYGY